MNNHNSTDSENLDNPYRPPLEIDETLVGRGFAKTHWALLAFAIPSLLSIAAFFVPVKSVSSSAVLLSLIIAFPIAGRVAAHFAKSWFWVRRLHVLLFVVQLVLIFLLYGIGYRLYYVLLTG